MSTYERTCLIRGDGGRTIRRILERIGNKWTLLVVATLHDERMRFTDLQQRIPGVSQRMLSLTLRQLERDGLVSRTAYAEVPPRVEYELTDVGRTLIDPAVRLAEWAVEHDADIERSQQRYDARQQPDR
ncbi:winged helix-turn-helix transcriptional regulator [Prauserella muralis]|uniref:Transcriptional regulator n=1 Tax=Prauserella muralis TaxID=588067 RepID=A0A2V4B3D9_9PSEU|nr:helix-turn-helix domain-containing protein [Prauserella muralis]PXY27908.1 transcriptional regulator [Prauserella muralis]TWE22311.1 HxlR family transcriptional regulator [Prauserella muralis]